MRMPLPEPDASKSRTCVRDLVEHQKVIETPTEQLHVKLPKRSPANKHRMANIKCAAHNRLQKCTESCAARARMNRALAADTIMRNLQMHPLQPPERWNQPKYVQHRRCHHGCPTVRRRRRILVSMVQDCTCSSHGSWVRLSNPEARRCQCL